VPNQLQLLLFFRQAPFSSLTPGGPAKIDVSLLSQRQEPCLVLWGMRSSRVLGAGSKNLQWLFQDVENPVMHLTAVHYSYVVNNQLTFPQVSYDSWNQTVLVHFTLVHWLLLVPHCALPQQVSYFTMKQHQLSIFDLFEQKRWLSTDVT